MQTHMLSLTLWQVSSSPEVSPEAGSATQCRRGAAW